jgi:hypothetical protein
MARNLLTNSFVPLTIIQVILFFHLLIPSYTTIIIFTVQLNKKTSLISISVIKIITFTKKMILNNRPILEFAKRGYYPIS